MNQQVGPLEKHFDDMFEALLRDLSKSHPHPLDWRHLLTKPPWWRLAARRAYWKNVDVFAKHGFILFDSMADRFERTAPQSYDEDYGGSMVRRLRQTFQYQTGVPFSEAQQ